MLAIDVYLRQTDLDDFFDSQLSALSVYLDNVYAFGQGREANLLGIFVFHKLCSA